MADRSQSASASIRNLHRVRRVLSDGRTKLHFYHRPTRKRLPNPASPEFAAAYNEAERQLAAQQHSEAGKPFVLSAPNFEPHDTVATPEQIPLSHTQAGKIGAAAKKPKLPKALRLSLPLAGLPLYPNEKQIAVAILGPQRAHEWKAKAALLEREGLPPIDPLMGGRSWVATQRFFAMRDGLDPANPSESNSPPARRVRYVPFAPDGRERSHAQEEAAVACGRFERRT